MSFPAEPASVSKARRFVRETLDAVGAAGFEECAILLVSELVTNAVLHARTAPEVTVRVTEDRVWVGVRDASPVAPAPKRYGLEAATGRGLQLVEQIAARWGVDTDSAGKTVWFELDPDSTERYARAQEAAILEGLAAIEIELGATSDVPSLKSTDHGTGPSAMAPIEAVTLARLEVRA
ncbi:MAG TPA: ATP-binding protein [Acidimicrobiales bacterium]|nr:ATP-binding protein [Acidimicrobiales bacterium]